MPNLSSMFGGPSINVQTLAAAPSYNGGFGLMRTRSKTGF